MRPLNSFTRFVQIEVRVQDRCRETGQLLLHLLYALPARDSVVVRNQSFNNNLCALVRSVRALMATVNVLVCLRHLKNCCYIQQTFSRTY